MKHLLLIAALLAASSAQALEPYLEVGVAVRNAPNILPSGLTYRFDANRTRNPYMSVAVGLQTEAHDFGPYRIRLSGELFHESSVNTGEDRGLNEARVLLRITSRK